MTTPRALTATAAVLAAILGLAGCAGTPGTGDEHGIRTLDAAEVRELRAGGGPELALVAELNGYPDTAKVLKHSAELGLSPDQRLELRQADGVARGRARALGERIVQAEQDLDRFMGAGNKSIDQIRARLESIAALRSALRSTVINAHVKAREILTDEQLAQYRELRGLPPLEKAGDDDNE